MQENYKGYLLAKHADGWAVATNGGMFIQSGFSSRQKAREFVSAIVESDAEKDALRSAPQWALETAQEASESDSGIIPSDEPQTGLQAKERPKARNPKHRADRNVRRKRKAERLSRRANRTH